MVVPRMVVLVALIAGIGCAPAVRRVPYDPRPAAFGVDGGQVDPDASARVLLSVTDLSQTEDPEFFPRSIEVRTRIENTGTRTISFDPASLQLVSGNLVPLTNPVLEPAVVQDIPPGTALATTAWFPLLPETPVDLAGLELAWHLDFEGMGVSTSTTVTRRVRRYVPQTAWWGYPWGGWRGGWGWGPYCD